MKGLGIDFALVLCEAQLIIGTGLYEAVGGLLTKGLGIEEVDEGERAGLVLVETHAEVFLGGDDALFGNGNLGERLLKVVPSGLIIKAEFFYRVLIVVGGLLLGEFSFANGVGTAPPCADGHGNGSEYDAVVDVLGHHVVVHIRNADGCRRHILAALHLDLQGSGIYGFSGEEGFYALGRPKSLT